MSKKSAKKRQPVKPVVAKEPARTAKNFEPAETMKVYQLLAELITSDVRLTIESATQGEG